MKLHELNADFRYAMKQLESAIENGDDETVDRISEILSEIGMSIDEKIENTALYIKELEAEVKAIKEEEERIVDRFISRRNAVKKRADRMREYICKFGHSVKTPLVSVSVRDLADRVVIDKTAEVPQEWCEMVVTYKPITDLIENKIKAGKCYIAGITLETNRKSVTIK